MSAYSWGEVLITAEAAGANLTASTTATSLLPTGAIYTLPANFFRPGKMLLIRAVGQLGNIVTTPGTLTMDVYLGGSVVAFNGGAMQLSSTAHTALPFWLEILLTCRAIGSGTSANLMGQGIMSGQALSLTAVADSTTSPASLMLPNTTPAVGTGFNSTAAQTVDLRATFSLSNANAIQLHQYALIALN